MSVDGLCRAMAACDWKVVLATAYRSTLDDPEYVLQPLVASDSNYARIGCRALATRRLQISPTLFLWLLKNISRFDIVQINSLYNFPVIAGLILARANNIPCVITTHDVFAPMQRRKSRAKKALLNSVFMNRALDQAAAIVYSTEAEQESAESLGIKAPSTIISWGISLEQFRTLPQRGKFRARFLSGSKSPIVLYLGRLAEKKGLDRLAEAFRKVLVKQPNVYLVIAGDGDPPGYRRVVEQWIQKQGLQDHTIFTGLLGPLEKLEALIDSDVFVLPSSSENFAVAMFEAMACRLPVVISSGVQLSTEVARSGAGLVADRPEEIGAAICHLLEDSDLRQQLGGRGYEYAHKFGWENTASSLIRLYEGILGRRSELKKQ